jgi:hypothetical protein
LLAEVADGQASAVVDHHQRHQEKNELLSADRVKRQREDGEDPIASAVRKDPGGQQDSREEIPEEQGCGERHRTAPCLSE